MLKRKRRGSLTLEAAIILPLAISIFIVLLFVAILQYSRISASVTINETTNMIATTWNSSTGKFSKFKETKGSEVMNMYFSSDPATAKNSIKNYIDTEIKKRLPMAVTVNTTVDTTNILVGETFNIKTTCSYNFPLGALFKFLGLDDKVNDTYTKTILVSDSVSNMRTIRYAKGLTKRILDSDLIQSVKKSVSEMKERLKNNGQKGKK